MKTTLTVLMEPVALILIAVLVGMGILARAHGARRVLLACAPVLGVYLVFATPIGANALIKPLEDRARVATAACAQPADRDVIVLLSGGARGGAHSAQDTATLQLASFRRAIGAVDRGLQVANSTLLISGGGGSAVPEADILRSLAVRLGFPAERIVVENASGTTAESAKAVHKMADEFRQSRIEPGRADSQRRADVAGNHGATVAGAPDGTRSRGSLITRC